MATQHVFNFITLLLSGLIAGLLFSYSCSVNHGLKALADHEYIKAMQAINVAIQNPLFLISFMGLLLVFPISSYMLYKQLIDTSFCLMLLAMIIYFVGVFGITLFYNVPLNEQLAKFNLSTASRDEITQMRQLFENPWNSHHQYRTIASIISFVLTILSSMKIKF